MHYNLLIVILTFLYSLQLTNYNIPNTTFYYKDIYNILCYNILYYNIQCMYLNYYDQIVISQCLYLNHYDHIVISQMAVFNLL